MGLKVRTPKWRRSAWIVGGSLGVLFLVLQLFRPHLSNPPVIAEIAVPSRVRDILRKSCYDCHSNETKLAWFDQIAPASWIVANDVSEGRRYLNFSEIGELPAEKQQGILFEAINQIELGAMPLRGYRWLHPHNAVSADDLVTLKDYLISTSPQTIAGASERKATSDQWAAWSDSHVRPEVAPAPNGIPFFSDYKTWTAISTTDRWDNQTMRVVLGNEIAVNAIRQRNITPWPDGAAFAKVAWAQDSDGSGNVQAGEFKQIEFMIKGAVKYADTNGWGWARWLGTELKPYGDNAQFSGQCIRCHTPVKNRDFVFTIPLETSR
ncbi:heme-binding domain-containing protein [Blastopirellula sp. J2-11]|uniref:heme-binding domain-containing protein n=1 Tax=Blastopirellula sp. J2-11 TaxID=2943192 RepID=UPI0021C6C246|nr:heme-binding domain-containing protein [Blastopirellula sp. J2-11]UUO04344.1 heme-binding domain-containing protein [Blastopirellula sp. J2-11]